MPADNPPQTPTDVEVADTPIEGEVDREAAIRRRAFEISQSEDSGTPEENWDRAERELSGADER